jgi:hypothetical protein
MIAMIEWEYFFIALPFNFFHPSPVISPTIAIDSIPNA